jgi:hypothetical protein
MTAAAGEVETIFVCRGALCWTERHITVLSLRITRLVGLDPTCLLLSALSNAFASPLPQSLPVRRPSPPCVGNYKRRCCNVDRVSTAQSGRSLFSSSVQHFFTVATVAPLSHFNTTFAILTSWRLMVNRRLHRHAQFREARMHFLWAVRRKATKSVDIESLQDVTQQRKMFWDMRLPLKVGSLEERVSLQ